MRVRSSQFSSCIHPRFHLGKLRSQACAQEYAVTVYIWFQMLGILEPWKVVRCLQTWNPHNCRRVNWEASKVLGWSCFKGDTGEYRRAGLPTWIRTPTVAELCHEGLKPFWRGELYIRGLTECVEGCLNANDLRLAFRTLKKLLSKSISQMKSIQMAGGDLVSDADGQSTFGSCM